MYNYKTTNNNALIIFARNPVVTNEKLRWAEEFQDKEAANIYLNSLKNVYEQTKNIESSKFLFLDMAFNHKKYDTGYQICIQYGNDAGMKLYHAFGKIFSYGHEKAVIVAADIPDIKRKVIEEAYEKLDTYDFVIGPTSDEGFYLLGTKNPNHEVFEDLSLTLKTVMEGLIDKIKTVNKSYIILNEISNIGTGVVINNEENQRQSRNKKN